MSAEPRDLGSLARELDELRKRLGRHDDGVRTAEIQELGDSVRRISGELRRRATLLQGDVVAHGRRIARS